MQVVLKQVLEQNYPESKVERGLYLDVTFQDDRVGLEIGEDGVTLDSGWTIVPLVYPAMVRVTMCTYSCNDMAYLNCCMTFVVFRLTAVTVMSQVMHCKFLAQRICM